MEIPYHFMAQIDGSLVEIDMEFHDYSMSFVKVLFVFHAGLDFRQVRVMEFPWHLMRK